MELKNAWLFYLEMTSIIIDNICINGIWDKIINSILNVTVTRLQILYMFLPAMVEMPRVTPIESSICVPWRRGESENTGRPKKIHY